MLMRKDILYTIGTVILGVFIAWPLVNNSSVSASKFDVVTFSDILNPKTTIQSPVDNYNDAIKSVQEVVDGARGMEGVDVESIVSGDFSSVLNKENVSPVEAVSMITKITTAHEAAYELKNTVSKVANETAYINQIQNSSFGDSMMDLKAEIDAVQKVVSDMNSMTEKINTLYKGIDMAMSAKSAFMPEKYDYPSDAFVICNDYIPDGISLLPKLTDGISFDLSLEDYINEDIFQDIVPDITLDRLIQAKYQGILDESFADVLEKGDLKSLLATGITPQELAAQANLAVSDALQIKNLNKVAEQYELEAQSIEHFRQKVSEQMDNFNQHSSKIMKLLAQYETIIKQFDSIKPPTT
jgi:hypothetical protein